MAVSIRGSTPLNKREALHDRWLSGERLVLISKPTVFGWGMNWQHCARVAFVGASYSYEAFYQAVRRTWRFGQKRPVHVHVALGATELPMWNVLARKRDGHDEMKTQMFAASRRAQAKASARRAAYRPAVPMKLPAWLCSEVA